MLKILASNSIFKGNEMGVNCLLNQENWIILSSDCQVEVDEVEVTGLTSRDKTTMIF